MSKIILHIGYPKTASTWFQNNFYPYIKNYDYIDNNEFAKYFFAKNETLFESFYNTKLKNRQLIICEERILEAKDYMNMIVKIKKYFNDPIIIIFIRNQIKLLESRYSLHIKLKGTEKVEEMIDRFFRTDKISQWNYYEYLKPYFNTFGQDKVKLYLFEELNTNFDVFMDSYIKEFNFLISQKISKHKKNISYSKSILKLARFTNQFSKNNMFPNNKLYFHIPLFVRTMHVGYRMLNRILPYQRLDFKKDLDEKIYNKLYNYFIEGNRKLAKEFHLDVKKYNYPL